MYVLFQCVAFILLTVGGISFGEDAEALDLQTAETKDKKPEIQQPVDFVEDPQPIKRDILGMYSYERIGVSFE